MISRRLQTGGPTCTQEWNTDNRLSSVTVNGQTTSFTYDGNGTLVKKATNSNPPDVTVYVGNVYEARPLQTGSITKYYYFNGSRIAMKQGGVLYYLAGDHLGTTSVAVRVQNEEVMSVSESQHYPYGGIRWSSGTLPTDYRWTGQRLDSYINLYAMGARMYDPSLGRWISPDSIIPDPANPQSLNRYSYVLNRPLVAIDPSGHDLVIVGGAGGNADLAEWMDWVMAYTGWDEETFKSILDQWREAVGEGGLAGGNTLLAEHGIHIFTWGGKTVQEATEKAGSSNNEDLFETLSDEMKGHKEITLLGWSKGGNLVMRYLQELPGQKDFTQVEHAVLLAPANSGMSKWHPEIAWDSVRLPENGPNAANVCACFDPVCLRVMPNAINFTPSLTGHGPHGQVAKQVLTALSVSADRHAWAWNGDYGGRR